MERPWKRIIPPIDDSDSWSSENDVDNTEHWHSFNNSKRSRLFTRRTDHGRALQGESILEQNVSPLSNVLMHHDYFGPNLGASSTPLSTYSFNLPGDSFERVNNFLSEPQEPNLNNRTSLFSTLFENDLNLNPVPDVEEFPVENSMIVLNDSFGGNRRTVHTPPALPGLNMFETTENLLEHSSPDDDLINRDMDVLLECTPRRPGNAPCKYSRHREEIVRSSISVSECIPGSSSSDVIRTVVESIVENEPDPSPNSQPAAASRTIIVQHGICKKKSKKKKPILPQSTEDTVISGLDQPSTSSCNSLDIKSELIVPSSAEQNPVKASSSPTTSSNTMIAVDASTQHPASQIESAAADNVVVEPAAQIDETVTVDDSLVANGVLNQGLLGLLECPVCWEFMTPPIQQCKRGHLVCLPCMQRLHMCPTCRCRFSQLRNLAMEKVADKLHYPCKNNQSGCNEMMRLADKPEHEANCTHRIYRCIVSVCTWRGKHPELLNHMTNTHQEIVVYGDRKYLYISLDTHASSENWIVLAHDVIFRVNFVVSSQYGRINGCVQYVGPRRLANNYSYTFRSENVSADGIKHSIEYTRTTHNDQGKLSTIYNTGDAFMLMRNSASFFSASNERNMLVRVLINKVANNS